MEKRFEKLLGAGAKVEGRRETGRVAAKVVAKHVSKGAGKAVARTAASPWLLAADVTEFAAGKAARAAGWHEDDVQVASKCTGAATSLVVGAAVGGPVGAAAGLALWGVGEAVGWLFN